VFKENEDGTLNPAYARLSPEQQAQEDAKPAYWGAWTRTPELPQLRLAAGNATPAVTAPGHPATPSTR
jgi:hypothetical protein